MELELAQYLLRMPATVATGSVEHILQLPPCLRACLPLNPAPTCDLTVVTATLDKAVAQFLWLG